MLTGTTYYRTHSGSEYFVTRTETQGWILGQVAPEGKDFCGKPQRILIEWGESPDGLPEVGDRLVFVGECALTGRPGLRISTSPVVAISHSRF